MELRQGVLAAAGFIVEDIKKLAVPVSKNEVITNICLDPYLKAFVELRVYGCGRECHTSGSNVRENLDA